MNCALSWIVDHATEYAIDPNQMALVGGSAGAHLALLAAYAPEAVEEGFVCTETDIDTHIRCVVDFYGPTDLRTNFAINHPAVEAFLGTTYSQNPEVFRQASPIVSTTWMLFSNGGYDKTQPETTSRNLYVLPRESLNIWRPLFCMGFIG